MENKKIGVIGAGVMGSGVAQNLAQSNFQVILIDISQSALEKAKSDIHNNVRFQGLMTKDKSSFLPPETVLERITFTTDYSTLDNTWYVIENVVEKWEAKADVYPRLDEICPAHTVFAVDTSCYSITRVASLTRRPDRVIGIHFMNPVPMKSAVEVIKGWHTSLETIEITKEMLTAMGKEWIMVNDSPGFVSNRVLMLTINEAIFLLQEQVAQPRDVDDIFKKCFGHKMGPLETADLIGLDTILYSIEVLHESFNDSKFRPCNLLKKMVDAGLLGRKSGKGFYTY
ncbi:MAG: 3-hydroxybutyryl-CoA dehydrogenase [Desulfamplus sp.]|nr:3-hydroxybutyryl-CoA dehydrogenase [Desulfamplus sp.]